MSKSNVTGELIKLKNVRLSFPNLWKPKAFEADREETFQASFLLDPSDASHAASIKEIKVSARAILMEAFGEVPPGFKRCFGLADKHPKKKDYDGYKGMFFIACGNTNRPTIVNQKREDVYKEDGLFYAGCYVNTNITFWTYDHPKGGKGLAANLRIVQFFRDGEAFGNAPAKADEELDDVDVDDSGADDEWDDQPEDDLD